MCLTEFEGFRKNIGKNVRRYRLEMNITQKEFGELANLDPNYLGGVERGERNISLKSLYIIAETLNVSVELLVRLNN